MKKISRTIALFFVLQILFLTIAPVITVAKADDLIIDYSGEVTLVVMGDSVLAVETTKNNPTSAPAATSAPSAPTKPATPPAPPSAAPAPTTKTVQKVTQVAPPSSSTTVKISPNTSSDKKLKITIETSTGNTTANSASPKPAQTSPSTSTTTVVNTVTTPVATSTPTSVSKTNVTSTDKAADNVVLRDQDKQPVLTITADQKQTTGVNIQQHDVNVSTSLPVQIDTKTHIISVQTSSGTENVSILPDQAVAGAEKQTNTNPTNAKPAVSLVSENGNATYIVDQQKKGKLLGIFDVTVPSQVKISAETGKTVSVWQSPVGTFLGFLIR